MIGNQDAKIDALAASELVSASLIGALIKMLQLRGVLTPGEVREVYEDALEMLETQQGSDPATDAIFEEARRVLEQQLR